MQETYKIPVNVIKKLCGLDSLKIENVIISNKTLLIEAVSNEKYAYCYVCNQRSKIKHSSYKRQLSTLPVSDLKTVISLKIYKYRCANPCCSRKIFSQQIKGLSNRYGRRTHSLNNKLEKISIEVSANKASYISSLINSPLSSSTCLRLVKRAKMLNNTDCVIVGIDDWAKRKGINYGTIIVDAETHKTIDLIDSRKKSDIVSWLYKYQTIKFITRDRAAFYASAISEALPHVKHIADKFHLIKNLSDAIFIEVKNMFGRIRKIAKNYINSSYVDINDIEAVEDVVMIKDDNHKYQAELDKRKTRFELFYNLKNKGLNNTVIARRTGYSRDTVRKYLTHGIPNIKNKVVLNYDDYLDDINVMCRKKINPSAMYKIIKDKGFNGSIKSFTGWFNLKYPNYKFKWNRDFTVFNDEVIIKQSLPSCKQFTLYLLNNQYGVNKDTGEISKEKIFIDNLICKIPELSEMQETYRSFCSIINGNSVEQLEQLRDASVNSKISHIFSFFKGLKKDWEAICNAVRYKWTNSLVEGCVNRLKIKKREMYGRAGFDLLRRKVCLSVTG